MEIRLRTNGVVMLENEWRNYIFKQTGKLFGQLDEATINSFESDVVFEGPQATGGTVYQYSIRNGIEQGDDGKWYTKYILGPIFVDRVNDEGNFVSAAEQEAQYKAQKDADQAKAVRERRNKMLADCDWTQLADSPVDKAKWAVHRQALRDITAQAGFPWNVQWPTVD
jgi:hypothetical protein